MSLDFYEDLKTHLSNVQSPDKETRTNAEQMVRQYRDEGNTKKFVASLVKEIADEDNGDPVRQMACIVCKNLVINKSNDARFVDLWVQLDNEFKLNVKQAIMQTLASPSQLVRSQIASLISAIAQIEIPRGEWTELIASLCTNASHADLQIKMASLQTIGYICEELNPTQLTQPLKNQIMLALTSNIDSTQEQQAPCKLAVKALLHSIPYTQANFQVQEEREFIMKKVFDALQCKDVDIREFAMQSLVEIGRQEYDQMVHFLQQISEVTERAATQDDAKVGCQGIEFWTTLAEVEFQRMEKGGNNQNYITTCKDFLIPLLLTRMQVICIEDDDEDEEWGVNMSSGCCLQKVSYILRNDIMTPVVEFVKMNIMQQDWKLRYASLMALGAISEGPDKKTYAEIIVPSIEQLLNMFQDTSIKVRIAISWVINQICAQHAEVMVSSVELTEYFVNVLVKSLQDQPNISAQSCTAIEKLAESLDPHDRETQKSNQLTPHFEKMATALMTNALRQDGLDANCNLVNASYTGLIALCQCSGDDSNTALANMLMSILQLIEQTISGQTNEQTNNAQGMLCGLLQVIMIRVGPQVDSETGEKIVKLIIMIFEQQQRVTENGLIAYQGVVTGLGDRVNINDFGKYIYSALEQEDDEDVTRVAIGIVADISSALGEQVSQYLSSLIPHLLNILKNGNRDRKTKLAAFISLADVAFYAAPSFCQFYLNDSLKIMQEACAVSCNIADFANDEDTLMYLEELRVALVDAYIPITQGVVDSNSQQVYQPFMAQLFVFLENYIQIERTPTVYKNVSALIADISVCQGVQIAPLVNQAWVRNMLTSLQQADDNESKETAQWAYQKINEVILQASTPTAGGM